MNRLSAETSPYLLQHAHNPVDWYPWGDEALSRARAEDKPILVSIGYAACHWCHVMERESFEDPDTAAFMNEHFVNIKIDREERPDLDHIYMDAVQAISGSGGWPLNVFLLPDGRPFYGGTYFPPRPIHNRSSWMDVLAAIVKAYREKRPDIEQQAQSLTSHVEKSGDFDSSSSGNNTILPAQPTDGIFNPRRLHQIFEQLMNTADRQEGGFGAAPKFPQTFSIQYLLHYYHFTREQAALQQACLSLDKMIDGGIYDHLGGGFARYSTDRIWLAPHFEKMLYDNALLVIVLSDAFKLTGNPRYRQAIEETMAFVRRELSDGEHAFHAALDADSEGEEGKYYVWSKAEIESILGEEDAALFCQWYGVTAEGNWEEKNILTRRGGPGESRSVGSQKEPLTPQTGHSPESPLSPEKAPSRESLETPESPLSPENALSRETLESLENPLSSQGSSALEDSLNPKKTAGAHDSLSLQDSLNPESSPGPENPASPEIESRLLAARQKLLAIREQRIRPALDDKILLGWNALMNIACSKAYAALGNEEYRDWAVGNMKFCLERFAGKDLYYFYHAYKAGQARFPAFLDDYAALIAALIQLQEITGNGDYLLKAKEILEFVIENFSEEENGFFFYTHKDQKDVIVRKKEIYDGATPSGNSIMATNLAYMSIIFNVPEWNDRAREMAVKLQRVVTSYPGSFGIWATLFQAFTYNIPEIVLTARSPELTRKELLKQVIPFRVFQSANEENTHFPLLRDRPVEDRPNLFLCKDYMCQLPVNDVDTLIRLVENVQKFREKFVQ